MKISEVETHKEPSSPEDSFRLTDKENHFQELLIKILKEERKEVTNESKKENRLLLLLSLFIFFSVLFQTFSFFFLYREIKALQPIQASAIEEPLPYKNPPIPKEEIIQPLLQNSSFHRAHS